MKWEHLRATFRVNLCWYLDIALKQLNSQANGDTIGKDNTSDEAGVGIIEVRGRMAIVSSF